MLSGGRHRRGKVGNEVVISRWATATEKFHIAEQSSMDTMTGIVGHGHAHQVRQGKRIIRKISDPEKDNNKDRFETPIIHDILVENGLDCDCFPLNLPPAAIRSRYHAAW